MGLLHSEVERFTHFVNLLNGQWFTIVEVLARDRAGEVLLPVAQRRPDDGESTRRYVYEHSVDEAVSVRASSRQGDNRCLAPVEPAPEMAPGSSRSCADGSRWRNGHLSKRGLDHLGL